MLNPDIVSAINAMIHHLQSCSMAYKQLAHGFDYAGLEGFAAFFRYEGHERWTLSRKISHFLKHAGAMVELDGFEKPESAANPQEALRVAMTHETVLVDAANEYAKAAMEAGDYITSAKISKWGKRCLYEKAEIHRVQRKLADVGADASAIHAMNSWLHEKYKEHCYCC